MASFLGDIFKWIQKNPDITASIFEGAKAGLDVYTAGRKRSFEQEQIEANEAAARKSQIDTRRELERQAEAKRSKNLAVLGSMGISASEAAKWGTSAYGLNVANNLALARDIKSSEDKTAALLRGLQYDKRASDIAYRSAIGKSIFSFGGSIFDIFKDKKKDEKPKTDGEKRISSWSY